VRYGYTAKAPQMSRTRTVVRPLLAAMVRASYAVRLKVSPIKILRWYLRSPEYHPLKRVLREHILSVG
jgi:hypothetical protein